ncbi:hypothetical protein KKF60_03120 [Patescibacteria group bacterium]|nr:hypothetical protein [Patescibacteria group bacterium]MBU4458861.1 hypothetical protein [Patescibacteria group bacterium]MCG2696146.1 hypothetical protein [Candidatus Portnoybacteria bacterium]
MDISPLTYKCEKSIQVYKESVSFIEKKDLKEKISKLFWAYYDIESVIPETIDSFWSGHIFPWKDSWEELQISFNLCLFGLYKQAMVSLRVSLELGLLSVYWNLNDDGHIIIKEWLRSDKDTPRNREIWGKLEQYKNIQAFQKKHDLKSRILKLGFLHNFAHSKGHSYSNEIGLFKSNCQTFEVGGFNMWFSTFEEIVKVLSVLHLIKYPLGVIKFDYFRKFGIDTPSFGGLDRFQIERFKDIIGKKVFAVLESIAKNDQHVKKIMKDIKRLPDMTKEKIEKQVIDLDKEMIKGPGFKKWFENEKNLLKKMRGNEKKRIQNRIKYLKDWAKKNRYMEPAWQRRKILIKK